MQSQIVNNSQSVAEVRLPGDSVGLLPCEDPRNGYLAVKRDGVWVRLCPWCELSLPPARRKPRKFCSEAHEKAFKRAGYISKKQHGAKILAETDAEFAHYIYIPQIAAYVRDQPLRGIKSVVKDGNFENVATPNLFCPSGIDNFRIPKYMRHLQTAHGEGSLATTPHKVTHRVDVNDRPVVKEPTSTKFERNAAHGCDVMRLSKTKPNKKRGRA